MIDAIINEIELQKDYLVSESIKTIYFGGGTPSFLNILEIEKILKQIYQVLNISNNAEITFEANPEDLNINYLKNLKSVGINRLSIGIQSFFDEDLKFMNRRHNAQTAINSVENSQSAGFDNISIDLIYSLPKMNLKKWENNLQKAFSLNIQHLSAYQLTIEKGTVFYKYLNEKRIVESTDQQCFEQFETLIEKAEQNGFFQYELSNFAKPGFESKHNSNYWYQRKYLGIGPSAHSYNFESRQWNISNNSKYIQSIRKGIVPSEIEILDIYAKYNEFIMTRLRTNKGFELANLKNEFGEKLFKHFMKNAKKFEQNDYFEWKNGNCRLNISGLFVSDFIISNLFWIP